MATRCARAAALLLGEHDFTSFRASACQAQIARQALRSISITAARCLLALRI
jgi:tRNA pseudouridine38-40 synthase